MSLLLRTLTLVLMVTGLILGTAIGEDTPHGKKKPKGDVGISILPCMTTQGGLPGTKAIATFEVADILDGLKIRLPAEMGSVSAQLVLSGSAAQAQFVGVNGLVFIDGSILTQLSLNRVESFEINVVGSSGARVKLKVVFGANGSAKITVY